jgi:hypothetical protein
MRMMGKTTMKGVLKKHFCIKFIPLKRLAFKDLGYVEKLCTIYEGKNPENFAKKQNFLKFISLSTLSIFFVPSVQGIYKLGINILVQPLLFRLYNKQKRESTMKVQKIYLCKNGCQMIIETEDSAIHLLNIKDISKVTEENDILTLEFFDKIFLINLQSENMNSDVLYAIRGGRMIDTYNNYSNYNRFTFAKYL